MPELSLLRTYYDFAEQQVKLKREVASQHLHVLGLLQNSKNHTTLENLQFLLAKSLLQEHSLRLAILNHDFDRFKHQNGWSEEPLVLLEKKYPIFN